MAGLTIDGFTPLTYEEILDRIKTRLLVFNPNFDFTVESPDGQLIEIMAFEISHAWDELDLVHRSYDPNSATGYSLKNIGALTGVPYGVAERSSATISLQGVIDTIVPAGSVFSDADGNTFTSVYNGTIDGNIEVYADLPGPIPVPSGSIINIETTVTGLTGVTQDQAGFIGTLPQTESFYRNIRNRTVLRNFTSVADVIQARLLEAGVAQAEILNNDTNLPIDGVPAQTIQVTVGEIDTGVTDEEIAQIILETKGLGCPTFGSTSVVVTDTQGFTHTINFNKAAPVDVWINLDVTFLTEDSAGAESDIREALGIHINSLLAGEDVIWSRLFEFITPYGKAQINSLEIGRSAGALAAANIVITSAEYAQTEDGLIGITIT
jgi:uncharacterized phage protein gp47/JayE